MRSFLLFFCIFSLISFSQEDADSLWNFDDLEPLDQEINVKTGKGYFPGVPGGLNQVGLNLSLGWLFNYGRNINSESFGLNTFSYNTSSQLPEREKTDIFDRFDKNKSSQMIGNSFAHFEIGYQHTNSFLPFITEFGLGFFQNTSQLVSFEGVKPFLNRDNQLLDFEEHSYLILEEYQLNFAVTMSLPIYGGYIQTEMLDEEVSLGSFYNLNLGFMTSLPFSSRMTQYNQISTRKNDIRYSNGYDTLNFMKRERARTLNEFRYYIKTGLSWTNVSNFASISFSINYYHQINAILTDTRWRNGIVLLETKIYFNI